jgi:hypothetical protein
MYYFIYKLYNNNNIFILGVIDISDKSKKTEKKIKPGYNKDKKGIQYTEQFNMAG